MNKELIVIHQPDFIPYLGFFDRLYKADKYVILDNVQFVASSRGGTHRDKIKTKNGAKWLTISIKKEPRDTAIKDIIIYEESEWRKKHLNLICENYRSADYYKEVMPYIEELYSLRYEKLMEFNIESIKMISKFLDI